MELKRPRRGKKDIDQSRKRYGAYVAAEVAARPELSAGYRPWQEKKNVR